MRQTRNEVGLTVRPLAKLAVVVYARGERNVLHTYFSCEVVGGPASAGAGAEYRRERQTARRSWSPTWFHPGSLPANLEPSRLAREAAAVVGGASARPGRTLL